MKRTSKRKGVKIPKPQDQVSWSLPRTGWHKLNTDGSVSNSKKTSTSGGLLRDDMGNWVMGFSRKLGDTTITIAEILAVREGLHLAWERRIPKLEIESDSEVVVNLIKDANVDIHPLGNIIMDCRNLIRMPWECRLVHMRRSGNTCADALAKNGHSLEDFVIWEIAPEFMLPLAKNGHSLEDFVIWEIAPEFMLPLLREDLM